MKCFKHVGELIMKKRIEQNLSRVELGLKLDTCSQFIFSIEKGEASLPLKKANKICEALNISHADMRLSFQKDLSVTLNKYIGD